MGKSHRGLNMVLQNDNFNDNSIDTSFWTINAESGVTVTEQNQRLEVNIPSVTEKSGGLVTKDSHDLITCDISVEVENDILQSQDLWICLTKVTNANPYFQNDWYRIIKYNQTDVYSVQKRKNGGTVQTLATGSWAGATGSLRITISNGTITFYENGIQRYSESYDLSSYTAYVYITARSYNPFLGMDFFDNFLGSSGAVPTPLSSSNIVVLMRGMDLI